MIKRKDITIINIDDYIRQERKRLFKVGGIKMFDDMRFYWDTREWGIMTEFANAATCNVFSGGCGIELKEGMTFMGSKHFKQKV